MNDTNYCIKCTKSHKQLRKKRFIGKNNPMFGKPGTMKGRTNYEVWLQKYGKEEADSLNGRKCRKNTK
jgi:hypothetical protein